MARIFGGPGIFPSNSAITGYGNEIEFQAGQAWTIPAGTFMITSAETLIQAFDPITNIWRPVGSAAPGPRVIESEGNNYRLANQTGCAVGAYVTTKGSGYTSAPTVVPTAGASRWASIIGGVLTSVVMTNGGANYTYPPIVLFDAPAGTPNPGVLNSQGTTATPGFMATGYATLTAGAVSSITLTDQGAGYASQPNVYILPDPRDTTGGGATATAVLGGAGQLTGVVCVDHGNPVTSAPNLTISGGGGASGAATPIMDFAVTGLTVSAGGTGFPASSTAIIEPIPTVLSGAAWTNPTMETNILIQRNALLLVPTSGGNALVAAGTIGFGGSYPAAPTAFAIGTSTLITGSPTITFTVGGVNETVLIAQL